VKLKDFIKTFNEEEDEIVKYFNKKDYDEFQDSKCIVCGKEFKEKDKVESDIKGNFYHKECFDKRFNKPEDLSTRQKVQPGE